jgi:hypothetical protein
MRLIRYFVCVLVATLATWSIGCGSGASAPDSGEMTPEMQQQIDSGEMTDPTGTPLGQRQELGEEAPESMRREGNPEGGGTP